MVLQRHAANIGKGKQDMTAPLVNLKARIESLRTLPAMPAMAAKVIQLKTNAKGSVQDLAKIIELDPSLSAQVIRYAQSPFFGYRGKVESVYTAIARVLGYELVMNLAFGIATARPFKVPNNGPLGLTAFWRHAIYCGALVQALSAKVDEELRPPAGLAYLAGLLHNFGLLVIGHLFPKEYMLLNKLVMEHPNKPISEIETKVFGVTHNQVGAWIMRAWNLQEEVIVTSLHHHNEEYMGAHEAYPKLVILANRALKAEGIGDEDNTKMPQSILDYFGMGEYMALMDVKKIVESNEELNAMITHAIGR